MAAFYTLIQVFLAAALIPGCQPQASRADDDTVFYACAGTSLSLPWTIPLGTGDVIESVMWYYSGRSEEMIATLAHGNFFVMPAFSGRVRQTTNAGLEIHDVSAMAAGNYSVEILVRSADGGVTTLWRSAYVHIADELQTSDGQLHARVDPVAEYDNGTVEFHVVLRCGTFTYPTHPPFDATWTTPSGQTVASSSYQDGSFKLIIPNPVEGGAYTCRVPRSFACIHNSTGESTVKVDKMEASLAVLAARQASLEERNRVLEDRSTDLEDRNRHLESQVQALQSKDSTQDSEMNTLHAETNLLKAALNQSVSFHARLTHDMLEHPSATRLVLSNVVTNIGNAYDPTTGLFTAPYNGAYFFIASTEDSRIEIGKVTIDLVMGDASTEVDYLETRNNQGYQAGSVHGVLQLSVGQNVWVRYISGGGTLLGIATSFSGFLIHSPLLN